MTRIFRVGQFILQKLRDTSLGANGNKGASMKRFFFVCAAMALLTSCATTGKYKAVLDSWVGSSADNLVSSWGPPDSSYRLSNGGEVLSYSRADNIHMPGYSYTTPQTTYQDGSVSTYGTYGSAYGNYSGTSTTYVQHQTAGYDIHMSCVTRFTVNPSGIITRWSFQGNACKSR